MTDDSREFDAEIIRDAYAERVREAFRVFADNLSMGENHRASNDRFARSLELARKARDMALAILHGDGAPAAVEPVMPVEEGIAAAETPAAPADADPLSAELKAIVDNAVGQTHGLQSLVRR